MTSKSLICKQGMEFAREMKDVKEPCSSQAGHLRPVNQQSEQSKEPWMCVQAPHMLASSRYSIIVLLCLQVPGTAEGVARCAGSSPLP